MDTSNIVSINPVIHICCKLSSVMNFIEYVVDIDIFRVVQLPGAKQRIFDSVVQTLPFLVLYSYF